MIALGGAWAVVGSREYSFPHDMESKERIEGVEKSKGKLPVRRRPSSRLAYRVKEGSLFFVDELH